MASIQSKKGKQGKTYYIVTSQSVIGRYGISKRKRIWHKVGKSKSEAESVLREFKKNPTFSTSTKGFEPIKFQNFVIEEFLPWCKSRKSDEGYVATKRSLALISDFFGHISIQDIDVRLIEQYITWRKQQKFQGRCISNRTVNMDLTFLSQCLKKAKDWNLVSDNECNKIPRLKTIKGRVRFFSEDEIKLMIDSANPYMERFIVVGITTRMRMGEMLNLKLSHINLAQNVIHIVNDQDFQTKTRKNRDIPISPVLRSRLQEYMRFWVSPDGRTAKPRSTSQKTYLFCNKEGNKFLSFRLSFTRFLKRLNINGAVIHTMRHTYASYLVMNGVNIRTVQELLGHSSISMTEIYAHLTSQHKQEAVKLLNFGKELLI